MQFQKPFHVENGVILDAQNREVRLWGVNYYAPFHHNYANLKEAGADCRRAIDRDIADFLKMGVGLVRMHLIDREISDMDGNVVENEHLELLDYLIDALDRAGIALMLTPVAWWNTTENQKMMEEHYAYWYIGKSPAFGFSNFYAKHCLIWHDKALACQEIYYRQLFSRKNSFSGKTWPQYENLVVLELINEPDYPTPQMLEEFSRNQQAMNRSTAGREEQKLLQKYRAFLEENQETDTKEAQERFCAGLLRAYLERMGGIVREFFGDSVLLTHIHYQYRQPLTAQVLKESPADCISVTAYAPCIFESTHKETLDYFEEIRRLQKQYTGISGLSKGLIAYEFNAPSTLEGYSLAALALWMAREGIQIAAYFTYTPGDVAAYNPGWLVHYLNLRHTPSRAAAFIAAGKIFCREQRGDAIPESSAQWDGDSWSIRREPDLVLYEDSETVIYSGSCPGHAFRNQAPRFLAGRGSSCFVTHTGSGCYFLKAVSQQELELTVLPDQWYSGDPYRGKTFRTMANRYVNINREPVVSRLQEAGSLMKILCHGFEDAGIFRYEDGGWQPVKTQDGFFRADPGRYRLTKAHPESERRQSL